MNIKSVDLVACFLFLTSFTNARADIITETFVGTASGIDADGLFGAPKTDLSGDTFTATYKFDTNLGVVQSSPGFFPLTGGSYYSAPVALLSATLTINNITQSGGDGSYLSEIYAF